MIIKRFRVHDACLCVRFADTVSMTQWGESVAAPLPTREAEVNLAASETQTSANLCCPVCTTPDETTGAGLAQKKPQKKKKTISEPKWKSKILTVFAMS